MSFRLQIIWIYLSFRGEAEESHFNMKKNTSHQQILKYTSQKVRILFEQHPVSSHNFDHIAHVHKWAKQIAEAEGANVFLCEMSAWLHDIGRTKEIHPKDSREHHEFSYRLCQEWFKEDPFYLELSNAEKNIILYAVRYHWNNAADKYIEAIILRDADKLDGFGNRGIKRAKEFFGDNSEEYERSLCFQYMNAYWIRTRTARKIFEEDNMIGPLNKEFIRVLKSKIVPIEL